MSKSPDLSGLSGPSAVSERSWLPELPPGHEAQPAWGFRGRAGRFVYEFSRVYQRPEALVDHRGARCSLDRSSSFWSVTWSASADDAVTGRSLTFAQARKRGYRHNYDRFSSLRGMDEELEALFELTDVISAAPAGGALRLAPVS